MRDYITGILIVLFFMFFALVGLIYFVPTTTDPVKMAGEYHWLGIVDWNNDGSASIQSVANGEDIVIVLNPNDPIAKFYYEHHFSFDDTGNGQIDRDDVIYSRLRVISFKHGNRAFMVPLEAVGIHAIIYDKESPRMFSKVLLTGGETRIVIDDFQKD